MKKITYILMAALLMLTVTSCDGWILDFEYRDTPSSQDRVVGSWESWYGHDYYGDYDIPGYDAWSFDFYRNHTGRYYEHGMRSIGFDWEIHGDRLDIMYEDGQFESLYYDFDEYGDLYLSMDYDFWDYTVYRRVR